MAKVFLDTNKVIDLAQRKPEIRNELDGYQVYLSPLSIHILCYANKTKVPDGKISQFKKEFQIIDLTDEILEMSLNGPTNDLEDNIQLHSAAKADCDYFLTNDKKLLKTGYFGKTKICSSLPVSSLY